MTRARRRERGAVSALVGLLLGMGVLFGVMAVSVDVGGLLWERRQLQNGADAAALSLAAECGKGNCNVNQGDLLAYAGRNANDKQAAVLSACRTSNLTGNLPLCAAPVAGLTECPPLPGALASMTNLPYVEVRTATLNTNGSFVTNWFAELTGNKQGSPASRGTTTVNACSRAAIGAPGGEGTADLPLTFSGCDWQHATGGTTAGGGGAYYPPPIYTASNPNGYGPGNPWPAAAATPPAQNLGGEVILVTQNPPGGATPATACPTWNGHALPGGFGTLETQATDPCKFVEYAHHWMHTSPGNNTGCDLSLMVGKVVNLPIFDCTNTTAPGVAPPVNGCTTGNGSNAYYHRAGYASFYLSGYDLNVTGSIPNKKKSLVTNAFLPCSGATRCISGWFLKGELSATTISGPPTSGGFGTYAVVPAG